MPIIPPFDQNGMLPPTVYSVSLAELRGSVLIKGVGSPSWDEKWRLHLVSSLEILVRQLWHVGVTEIFIDGSFAEDKDHPNDIDGYFECDLNKLANGDLIRELNLLDPHKIWTWDPLSRRPYPGFPKKQLPMWHAYRVELYPHVPGFGSGMKDKFGVDLEFPSAFRQSRSNGLPKGIVKVEFGGSP